MQAPKRPERNDFKNVDDWIMAVQAWSRQLMDYNQDIISKFNQQVNEKYGLVPDCATCKYRSYCPLTDKRSWQMEFLCCPRKSFDKNGSITDKTEKHALKNLPLN